MSDPQRVDGRSAFEPVPETEDMSVFLHNLLHASPAGLATTGGSSAVLEYRGTGASLNFSDPGCFFESEAGERVDKAFYSAASGDCDAGTSSSKREELISANKEFGASEATRNRLHPSSSKRIRSAEVHNMSEKRRRSKINEKLKALQNLVPNSNKTDKASMLDEAIDYLKQLQLHVQMLTIRNGYGLHPNYVQGGCLSSIQLPVDFDAGVVLPNTNRGTERVPGNQEVVGQSIFTTHNPKIHGHELAVPSLTNNSGSAMSFGAEPSLPSHFGFFNNLASSTKDLCREETQPNFTLDASCSRNKSTSGVSS